MEVAAGTRTPSPPCETPRERPLAGLSRGSGPRGLFATGLDGSLPTPGPSPPAAGRLGMSGWAREGYASPMRLLAALVFVVALGVNALANRLPLGGRTTGELSALYPNLFVPAGVTFSIWGIIYLLVGAWAVVQFLPGRREPAGTIAPAFAATSVLNAAWLFAWHYEQVLLSVAVMTALLGVLLHLNHRLDSGTRIGPPPPGWPLARAAFGLYLGWISVALIANVTALLVARDWSGWGIPDPLWATVLVLVGAGAAIFTILRLRTPWVGAAVTWAILGILLNRWADHPGIAAVAGVAALAVAGVAVAQALGVRKKGASPLPGAPAG
jgi:hypothetical protein